MAQAPVTHLRHFDQELEQLKSKLLAMSALVEAAVYRSITAVVQKDHKLAEEVLQNEPRINKMEIDVDELAISLLALHAAHGSAIYASLSQRVEKINTDLERMGDLAVSIAERAMNLIKDPIVQAQVDIPYIGGLVQSMVRKALDAFVTKDAELAQVASWLQTMRWITCEVPFTTRTDQLYA